MPDLDVVTRTPHENIHIMFRQPLRYRNPLVERINCLERLVACSSRPVKQVAKIDDRLAEMVAVHIDRLRTAGVLVVAFKLSPEHVRQLAHYFTSLGAA